MKSGDQGEQPDDDAERRQVVGAGSRDQVADGLHHVSDRVERGDRVDPPSEQMPRDVDGGEEEEEEDRHLHQRRRLQAAEAERHAGGEEQAGDVDDRGERVHPEHVEAVAADVQADEQPDQGDDGDRDRGANQRDDPVAEDERTAVGGGEQQPAAEAELEVGRDREAAEDAAERGALAEDEGEDERGVAGAVVEAGHLADRREAAREGREEEERHQHRRQEEQRVREQAVQQPPREPAGNREVAPHVRAILSLRPVAAKYRPTARMPSAQPKPSASASPSHPVIRRLRSPSTM